MTKKSHMGGFSPLLLLLTIIISFILVIIFTSFGSVKIPFEEIIKIFTDEANPMYKTLILDLRLPRVIGSFLVGSILAISGNILQLIIQNPLADPYIIGISSGASFGAVLYTALSSVFGITLIFGIEFFSFAFAMATTFIVLYISREGKKIPILSLILSGVIISFLFNSLSTLLTVMYWRNLIHVNLWLMGSTGDIGWNDNIILFIVLTVLVSTIFFFSKELNVLSMGDNLAVFSGINPEKIKILLIVISVLAVSTAVAKAGIIGFVGLIIPHIVRMIKGPHSRLSSLYNLFLGGIFLMICDYISRTIFAPSELPIGVITSLAGAPLFIYVMKKSRNKS